MSLCDLGERTEHAKVNDGDKLMSNCQRPLALQRDIDVLSDGVDPQWARQSDVSAPVGLNVETLMFNVPDNPC